MKNKHLLLVLFSICTFSLFAQTDSVSKYQNNKKTEVTGSTESAGNLSSRRVLKRVDLKSVVKENGTIVIYICIDRYGRVVKSMTVKSKSSIKDDETLLAAAKAAKGFRFNPSPESPAKDCMEMKFVIENVE